MRLTHTLLFLGLAVGLAACGHDGSDTTEPVGPTLDAAVDDDPATAPADDAMGDDAMADAAGGTMPAARSSCSRRRSPNASARRRYCSTPSPRRSPAVTATGC